MSYKDFITEVPNFPKDGIGFKDISPLLLDQETFRSSLVDMGGYFDDNLPDYWIGIDSRGFTFGWTELTLVVVWFVEERKENYQARL